MFKVIFFTLSVLILSSSASFAEDGKKLYKSSKFNCVQCHGENGEGGVGPSFKGIGKRLSHAELMRHAAHNCPPTGACDPKQLGAIVEYLRTL